MLGGHTWSFSSYGFAMHVPYHFYSQQPIREAARRGLESAVMFRALAPGSLKLSIELEAISPVPEAT